MKRWEVVLAVVCAVFVGWAWWPRGAEVPEQDRGVVARVQHWKMPHVPTQEEDGMPWFGYAEIGAAWSIEAEDALHGTLYPNGLAEAPTQSKFATAAQDGE